MATVKVITKGGCFITHGPGGPRWYKYNEIVPNIPDQTALEDWGEGKVRILSLDDSSSMPPWYRRLMIRLSRAARTSSARKEGREDK